MSTSNLNLLQFYEYKRDMLLKSTEGKMLTEHQEELLKFYNEIIRIRIYGNNRD